MGAGSHPPELFAERRRARWLGIGGFTVAAVTPVVLFHHVVAVLATDPKLELHYLSGWIPWLLLAAGLGFLAPVAFSAGMDPEHPRFPRARGAYSGWGVSLYLLGLFLAWQVSAVQGAAFG